MEQTISVKELIELLTYLGEEKMIEYKDGLTVEALISDGLDAMGKAMETALDNSAELTEEEAQALHDYDFTPLEEPQPFIPWNNDALDQCVQLLDMSRNMIKASVDGSVNPIITQRLQYFIPMDASISQAYKVNIVVHNKPGRSQRFVVDVKSVRVSDADHSYTISQQLLHIRGGKFGDMERMITTSIASHYAYVTHHQFDDRMYQMVKARLMNIKIKFKHWVNINDESSPESTSSVTFGRTNERPLFKPLTAVELADGDMIDDLERFIPTSASEDLIVYPYNSTIGNSIFAKTQFTTIEFLAKEIVSDYGVFIRRWRDNDPVEKDVVDTPADEIPTTQNSTNN